MSNSKTSSAGARVIAVLDALKGHALHGLSNDDLAKTLNLSPATIHRCLNTLIESGYGLKLDTGRYSQGMKMLQNAQAFANEVQMAQGKITELTQRVHAGSH